MKTNSELKHIAQEALRNEYGFAPHLNEIVLLESNDTGTYILFSVKGIEYRFESRIYHLKGLGDVVWAGPGTIEKTGFQYDK